MDQNQTIDSASRYAPWSSAIATSPP